LIILLFTCKTNERQETLPFFKKSLEDGTLCLQFRG